MTMHKGKEIINLEGVSVFIYCFWLMGLTDCTENDILIYGSIIIFIVLLCNCFTLKILLATKSNILRTKAVYVCIVYVYKYHIS